MLHQSEFQNLEALWRGMDMILRRIETGPSLQVLLVDVSAEEFAADLSGASDLSETGLYSMLVDKPSQDKNGGVSLILRPATSSSRRRRTPSCSAAWPRSPSTANAPFITSITSDAFTDRRNPPHPLMAQALEALRELPESSHLALLAPRFMLRHPYGKKSDPISAFAFEEFTPEEGLRGMLWGHPALLAATAAGGAERQHPLGRRPAVPLRRRRRRRPGRAADDRAAGQSRRPPRCCAGSASMR